MESTVLLPQCLLTLNFLRRSRINPQLSAQAQINGAFDFNCTPLAPPGTMVLIHEKPSTCDTWAPHAIEGWYLGPALRHYRCYIVWAWATTSERITDTLTWFPTMVVMPRHSTTDIAIAAAHDLAQALLSPSPSSSLPPIYDSQHHQLLQLSNIFLQHTSRTDDLPVPAPIPRVMPSPAPPQFTSFAVPESRTITPPSSHIPIPAPVQNSTTPTSFPRVTPTSTAATPKCITWATSVMGGIAHITTYQTATLNPDQRRRRATTAQKNAADRADFLSASITIHPGIKSHTWCKRRSASRRSHRQQVHQPLPAMHVNHDQRHSPHVTITSHVASFATQIAATAIALQSAHTVIDAITGEIYEHAQLIRGPDTGQWLYSTANEFGRLTKGVAPHMPSGSETMRYLFHHQLPPGRQATYARFVAT
jgi:hypothetical protein